MFETRCYTYNFKFTFTFFILPIYYYNSIFDLYEYDNFFKPFIISNCLYLIYLIISINNLNSV